MPDYQLSISEDEAVVLFEFFERFGDTGELFLSMGQNISPFNIFQAKFVRLPRQCLPQITVKFLTRRVHV